MVIFFSLKQGIAARCLSWECAPEHFSNNHHQHFMRNLCIAVLLLVSLSACHTYKITEHPDKLVRQVTAQAVVFTDGSQIPLPYAADSEAIHLILVRHAEKSFGNDAVLLPEGKRRAILLSEILDELPLQGIYATRYIRTQQTAKPTAKRKKLEVDIYPLDQPTTFANKVMRKHKGHNLLIAGHSDATPDLINHFLGKNELPRIDERDYDHFYILSINRNKEMELLQLRYRFEKEQMD
jgi:2,3-bisphosphoglycerate-dependent phosphoglycerate mutase